jgi:two-component system, response regulator
MVAKGTILLVEDNDDDVALTLRAMKRTGIEDKVVVARDGGEALEYLFAEGDRRQTRDLPWLVLLDLRLPRIDGLETLSLLRANNETRLLPVIVLSASNDEQDIAESYRLGANSYLKKPTDFDDLIGLLRTIHVYWTANEIPCGRRHA